eukprot:13705521-Alexandrium_andersonii.AAC.1
MVAPTPPGDPATPEGHNWVHPRRALESARQRMQAVVWVCVPLGGASGQQSPCERARTCHGRTTTVLGWGH